VYWAHEHPARLDWSSGEYSWPLLEQSRVEEDGILFPRRFAMDDEGSTPSSLEEIARRSDGSARWAVLRGDVDHFDQQLRRAGSIEDHIHLSVLVKEFFAGELAVLGAMPDFWRRVTILYRGGDDFAVIGSWDALLLLARELQRLFEKFVAEHLAALPGVEAKTVSMALAIAPEIDSPISAVFQEAGTALRAAKATEVGSFNVFGRTLEWKRLSDAEELKNGLLRLARGFGFSPIFINDLASVYREAFSAGAGRRSKAVRVDRPWRTYMRLSRVIPQARGKEFLNLRNAVITSLLGTRSAGIKLRPSARVGLEWARLAANN
jgi:CRISPR-associated protein Csm1